VHREIDFSKGLTKLLLMIFVLFIMHLPCLGQITRQDWIAHSLDYYAGKIETNKENEKSQQGQPKKQTKEQKAKKDSRTQRRMERIKKALRQIKKDTIIIASVEEKYNDNIYLTNNKGGNKNVSDFITTFNFNLKYSPILASRFGHTKVSLTQQGGPSIIAVSDTQTDDEKKAEYLSRADILHRRGKYGLDTFYQERRDNIPIKLLGVNEPKLTRFLERSYGLTLRAGWRRFPTDLRLYRKETLYKEVYKDSDTTNDTVKVTSYLNLAPKTRLRASYRYGIDDYPKKKGGTSRSNFNELKTGIEGKLSTKLKGTVNFGYKLTNYETNTDQKIITLDTRLDYRLSRRLLFELSLYRDISTTKYLTETWTKTNRYRVGFTYLPTFNKKISLNTYFSYTAYKFDTASPEELYEVSLTSDYALKKWLRITGQYKFAAKGSDNESVEYKNNIVSLKVTAQF
jgi:hypothetical protein